MQPWLLRCVLVHVGHSRLRRATHCRTAQINSPKPRFGPWLKRSFLSFAVAEAGGTVTALDGAPFDLSCRAVLGGASGIHDELLTLLREADAIAADPESPR